MSAPRWLMLIHSIPPLPAYFRVRVRRRLRKLGAIALKNSVYLLENTEDALEDLRWLAQEIRAGGGQAIVANADLLDGPSDEALLARAVGAVAGAAGGRPPDPAVDGALVGRVWVTRAGVKVDRMASAWLIRSRIDSEATFRFATDQQPPRPGEIRFDMYEGEFTHQGERCTFEELLHRFDLTADRSLVALGEVIHDLDCKDDRFRRPETAGIALMIDEIIQRLGRDEDRLTAAFDLFETLCRAMR